MIPKQDFNRKCLNKINNSSSNNQDNASSKIKTNKDIDKSSINNECRNKEWSRIITDSKTLDSSNSNKPHSICKITMPLIDNSLNSSNNFNSNSSNKTMDGLYSSKISLINREDRILSRVLIKINMVNNKINSITKTINSNNNNHQNNKDINQASNNNRNKTTHKHHRIKTSFKDNHHNKIECRANK